MSDETTLLPCPWCSEYPEIAEDGGSTGPWFSVWHDCPPVEGGKARHYGESLGCISISTAWFHTEAEAIAAWNTRATHGTLTAEQVRELIAPHLHARPTFDFGRHGAVWVADFQAIADELNAELGGGTCEVQHVKSGAMYDVWRYTCCGYEHAESVSEEAIPQNFCPKCGAKAVMQ